MIIQPYSLSIVSMLLMLSFLGNAWGSESTEFQPEKVHPPDENLQILWEEITGKHFPVAIISGTLEAYDAEVGTSVELKLRVIDQINKKEQEWIYDPLKVSGEYKMFLRPNRTYEIHIIPLKEGYKEHKTQIYIPRSTYAYEFSRKLRLDALKSETGQVIATKVSVIQSSHRFTRSAEIKRGSAYYDGLIGITMTAIERSDSEKFMQLVYSGHIPDTITQQLHLEEVKSNPHYDRLITTIETAIEKGNRTPIDSLIETSEMLNEAYISDKFLLDRTAIHSESFHFDKGSSLIAPKDAGRLKLLAQTLKKGEKKYILQINGYSDLDGLEAQNELLSKQRAVNILQVLQKYQVKSENLILILNGFGSIETDDPQKGRRADVRIFELP